MNDDISSQDVYEQVVLTRQEQVALKQDLAELEKANGTLRRVVYDMQKELSEVYRLRGRINFIFYVALAVAILFLLQLILFFWL